MVGIIMGSKSDLPVMQGAADILAEFGVPTEVKTLSAHRTPEHTAEYAKTAKERGIKVLIAGAGGAAALPGTLAALTTLPVIGVPIRSQTSLEGWDSILSMVQMPSGVPVATVGLDAAMNAGLLAAQILALGDANLMLRLEAHKRMLVERVLLN